ncbi:MAG: hypothetical protein M1445_03345 [Bacteroidetes bacterium]|nr:hypothetical protein [Bacteroidota bacterium]MCL6103212.1 hypothetical protein [Bacteroidota bacterium]
MRTANCCHNAEFDSLYDIISYYEQGSSFSTIRNAGKLTCEELKNLCENYLSNLSDFDLQNVEGKDLMPERKTKGELLYESLSTNQSLLIEQKYSELISHCSVRTCNGLRKFTANEFIESYLISDSNELIKIKNIGKKSINEILEFRLKLKAFIDEIKYVKDSSLQCIRLNTINKYGDFCDNDFVSNFYEKYCHLPMFWILEQYIKNDNSTRIEILIDSFHVFQHRKMLSLEEMAQKHNFSRERVRQIRNGLFHNILRIPIVLIDNKKNCNRNYGMLQSKDDWAYLLDTFKEIDIFCQESYEIQNCLKEEECNFSVEFVLQIVAYIFRDKYSLFGGIDVSQRFRIWDTTFLVKNEYSDIFDFEKMRDEFSNVLMDNETDYLLDIEDYIANSQCWVKYDYNKTYSLVSIVRDILLYEFHLYSDGIDGRIKIPANKERKPIDVIYEILHQTGRPMHLDEIFEEFKIILPEHKYTEAAQLRPYLQRHEAISYRNRKSVYTLKEWEHIKTGTIRDAIVEFLSENDLPQTADDITEYVLQYFPETNIASVRTSMFNDTQKRFSFFKDNIFGLKDKEYPSEYELGEQQEVLRRSFEQRLLDLEIFIVEKGHFPFVSSGKSKEGSLGRWWYRIINNKQQISESQQTEVNRVKVQYAEYDTDKTIYDWSLNYNKLKCFLLENRRIPFARGDEKFLYRWLSRVNEDFQNYRLTEEQRQKYIDLAKLI